jgi:peroxiredoxin family protein/TusA-related sulfurtransferase
MQHGYDVRNLSGGYKTWGMFHPPGKNAPCGPGGSAPANDHGEVEASPAAASQAAGAPVAPAGVAEKASSGTSARAHDLDVTGLCCPGPIVAVADALKGLAAGETLRVTASDVGFLNDIPAWCSSTGHELLSAQRVNGHVEAVIRKGAGAAAVGPSAAGAAAQAVGACSVSRPGAARSLDKSIVVFSSDLDRVLAALVIANGALAMGQKVSLFFTFWGLNVLRRPDAPAVSKNFLERMFGRMMPRGPQKLALSKMHMAGMGTAMMRHVMKSKHVADVTTMLEQARRQGARLIACTMSMDVMGIKAEELIEGVELGGVATYLGAVDAGNATLFI